MEHARITEALAGSSLFQGMGEAELLAMAGRMKPRVYRRGEVIFRREDPAGALHLIQSGSVKISLDNDEGKETVLALFGPGACFGEIAALDGGPRSATVTAVEPTETLALLRTDLLDLMRSQPDVALALIGTLATRLRRIDARLEDAHFLDLDTRFARLLASLAEERGEPTAAGVEIKLPLTQSELAAMIGATRVSANRLLGAYQDAGLVRLQKRSIVLTNMPALLIRAGRAPE